ncbi:hypothetical protein O6H91_11G113500 [Diphasiastrum complanatum]|uniref:Uncharacterized protein n=1 Tax=Diphasiastrum complanatum TaxID=34168 RepID=A0ACC2CD38_DIPCM|nr:hypothetical protein O6H91_11G113500 [Diphasiastrum complanatum]
MKPRWHSIRSSKWIKRLLTELKVIRSEGIPLIKCDNKSAQSLATNPIFHARSKHLKVAYHFVREKVQLKEVKLEHVDTSFCVADILTKPLLKASFDKLDQPWSY